MSTYIAKFNPQQMSDQDILSLITGREKLFDSVFPEMKSCLNTGTNHHFLLHGPRGIGKSFFTTFLKIKHDAEACFSKSQFILFPEEQSNVRFVSDIIDMLCAKLNGQHFSNVMGRWSINADIWRESKKQLKECIEEKKNESEQFHVFFSMENLQEFIPQLDQIENGRFREFLEEFSDITLIGTSLRPDLDNDYDKRLFQVFKKYPIRPWDEDDFIQYYRSNISLLKQQGRADIDLPKLSENRMRAISAFSGGSPRLAVILNKLVIEDDITGTLELIQGIMDELTPYYQDLTKSIPPKSKILFDTLIRSGENMTQSQLAKQLGQQQNTIARAFRWLTENYYIDKIKQKQKNISNYFVRDRIYVLYYQHREVFNDQHLSFINLLSDFLTNYYSTEEFVDKTVNLLKQNNRFGRELAKIKLEEFKLWKNNLGNSEILNLIENKRGTENIILKIDQLQSELKVDPNNIWKLVNLGIIYQKNENISEALRYIEKAQRLMDAENERNVIANFDIITYFLGLLNIKNKNTEIGCTFMIRGIAIGFLSGNIDLALLTKPFSAVSKFCSAAYNAVTNISSRSVLFELFTKLFFHESLFDSKQKLEFLINVIPFLVNNKHGELVNDIISEVELNVLEGSPESNYYQVVKYILNPDEYDLATLHPDIRTTVLAIQRHNQSQSSE